MKIRILIAAVLSPFILAPSSLHAQGALTPPGSPAPTMKSLDQIEPRMPISALPYTISAPGSYYLTTNLTGISGQNGITIGANDVALDLRGFVLSGVAGSLDGITAQSPSLQNISVRNGTLRSWGAHGLYSYLGQGWQIERLRVFNNGNSGLFMGLGATVKDCVAEGNGAGWPGIYVYDGSLIIGCVARTNGIGIQGGTGVIIKDCTCEFNSAFGIYADANSSVSGCVCVFNNAGVALNGSGSTLTGCSLSWNTNGGLNAIGGDNFVCDNNVISNTSVGINLNGSGNRVERNNVVGNYSGFAVGSTNNLIIGNSARGNQGNDYTSIGAGNTVGPIVTSTNIATDSNPHANYQF